MSDEIEWARKVLGEATPGPLCDVTPGPRVTIVHGNDARAIALLGSIGGRMLDVIEAVAAIEERVVYPDIDPELIRTLDALRTAITEHRRTSE